MNDDVYQFELLPCGVPGNMLLRRVNFTPPLYVAPAPGHLYAWLSSHGWERAETTEDKFTNPAVLANGFMHAYTWEQVMAIEFFRFINIGVER